MVGLPIQSKRIAPSVAGVTGVHRSLSTTVGITSTASADCPPRWPRAHAASQLAERAVERARQLIQADVIGSAELQRRESELSIARAELRAAGDQLQLMGLPTGAIEQLRSQGTLAAKTAVVATLSGVVIERQVSRGQVAQPGDPLFTVADLGNVWVVGGLPEQAARSVQPGQAVETPPAVKPETPPTAAVEPKSKETELYDKSIALYRDGKYEEAVEGFRTFLKTFPKSDRADNAHFLIGESYMALKQYEQAILAYQEVIKNYPKGNKVPSALLRQAVAFLEIKDQTSAKLLLNRVVKNHPNSSEAKIAQKKLETLK